MLRYTMVYERPRLSVAALCLSFLLAFSAYRGLVPLQSSINPSGLGTSTLAGTALIFCGTLLLLTAVQETVDSLMERVGYCWVMVVGVAVSSIYVLAQTLLELPENGDVAVPESLRIYVRAVILSSAMAGMGGALTAFCIVRYLENVVHTHPELAVMTTGLFVASWKLASFGGNLVSSVVLFTNRTSKTIYMPANITETCGLQFWPGGKHFVNNEISNLNRPTNNDINAICGTLCLLMLLAMLIIILGVEDPERSPEQEDIEGRTKAFTENNDEDEPDTFMYTMLLAPMWMSLGIGYAFLEADFTSAFITCFLGLKYVGWMMMYNSLFEVLGVTIGLYAVANNMRRTGCVALGATAILLQVGVVVALMTSPICGTTMFGGVVVFGLGSGLLLATTALEKTTRLAPFMMFQLAGLILGYSYSMHLRTDLKLYILVASLILGLIGYLAAEINRMFQQPSLTASLQTTKKH